jgi:diguanylate cyclase (GGDEF)-like protein
MTVTQSELMDFNLRHHVAPVVPKLMAITGLINACGWFVSLSLGNPHLGRLAVEHMLGGLTMVLLGVICHRTASAGRATSTTVVSILFVLVTSSFLCLTAANNHTGLLQSLPYCMVLTAVSGFFWLTRWGLVVGSFAGMIPPFFLVVTGNSLLTLTPHFFAIYVQLWMCAVVVSFALYAFMNRVRRRYVLTLRELEEQARRDSLTGLLNRRHFADGVAALRVASPARTPAMEGMLLYIDIDHFKMVNDRFGHAEGDRVLQRTARALEAACEPSDLIARLGGEEFAVFRPDGSTAESACAAIAERLRMVLSHPDHGRGWQTITVSVGGTSLAVGERLDDALQRADHALFRAKHDGRDRVVFAPPVSQAPEPFPDVERTSPLVNVTSIPQVAAV